MPTERTQAATSQVVIDHDRQLLIGAVAVIVIRRLKVRIREEKVDLAAGIVQESPIRKEEAREVEVEIEKANRRNQSKL